ncbi:MAG TPA: family 10 glycosylhydrolase [Gemmatimonadaceae bacterium]|nr:family 10 glycosylhydrolase [Gemmatimonadaceae bacterium]
MLLGVLPAAGLVSGVQIGEASAQRPRPTAEPCAFADASCIPPDVSREFRGLWIATVANIDWPSKPGLSTAAAKRELIGLLDRAKASGLNAVIFQVRPAADALYESKLEPWSEYLTGAQGVAPSPRWDPLAFAVAESHRRGLELHAWFNPYRARHPSAKGSLARSHIANTNPRLVRRYGTHLWMDPGEYAVRERTIAVILDVVNRYDIDGVHIDDYFYPYRERAADGSLLDFPDSVSFERYRVAGGPASRDDWRRENVNLLVQQLDERIHEAKPWVKFGISPFGIWRPGYPWQIRGLDAYTALYADARLWLREGWVDYFSPQLYWRLGTVPQSYRVLLGWWSRQNVFARHMWPGNFTSRVGEVSSTSWLTPEIEGQIEMTRAQPGASGNVHFSAKVFVENRDSIGTRLGRGLYAELALVPPSPWLDVARYDAPRAELRAASGGAHVLRVRGSGPLSSAAPDPAPASATTTRANPPAPRWWLVQVRRADGSWTSELVSAARRDIPIAKSADRVAVRAIDRAGVESAATVLRIR